MAKVKNRLQSVVQSPIKSNDFLKSLPGYHAFTVCDTASAFAGKGKAQGLKLLTSNDAYVKAFSELGLAWNISDNITDELESFVCELYGKNSNIDELRYAIFCAQEGKVEPEP